MIKPCEPRMYMILREDLAFKWNQGAHALAKHALQFPKEFEVWNNQYLIGLSVFNGLALSDLNNKLLEEIGLFKYSIFFEPDLRSELPTAICIFEDGSGEVSHALKDLKLATK